MGQTIASLKKLAPNPVSKMAFSAVQSPPLMQVLEATERHEVVLIGLETHICVGQTALDLLDQGFDVVVCPDAVSSRSNDRHKLGMERMRDAGVVPAHTEAAVYEWMQSADNPKFREVLSVVKRFP